MWSAFCHEAIIWLVMSSICSSRFPAEPEKVRFINESQEFEVSSINRAKIQKFKKNTLLKKTFSKSRLKKYKFRPGKFLEKFCIRNVLAVYSSRNFLPMRRLRPFSGRLVGCFIFFCILALFIEETSNSCEWILYWMSKCLVKIVYMFLFLMV